MLNTEFKDRLNQACDDSPYVPEYGKGRQVVVAKRLKVSQEAARKWFTGESTPSKAKIKELSEFLGVDQSWLALGITQKIDPKERRELESLSKGAVHALAGMIHFEGGASAFPSDADNTLVDIYAITRGKHIAIHVSMGRLLESGKYEFIVPRDYIKVHVVGVVSIGGGEIHWIDMPTNAIDVCKSLQSGDYAITLEREGSKYHCEGVKFARFKTVGEIL